MVHSVKQVDPWSPSRLQWAVGNTGKTFSINSFSYPISGLVPTPHFFIMHDKTRVFWQGQTRRIRDYKWHGQRHTISKCVAIPMSFWMQAARWEEDEMVRENPWSIRRPLMDRTSPSESWRLQKKQATNSTLQHIEGCTKLSRGAPTD